MKKLSDLKVKIDEKFLLKYMDCDCRFECDCDCVLDDKHFEYYNSESYEKFWKENTHIYGKCTSRYMFMIKLEKKLKKIKEILK